MLLRFSVSNHLSIRDAQQVSFVASPLRDRSEGLISCESAPNGLVLPAIVLYGPNASGKSNLVAAMHQMCMMVLESHVSGEPGGGVPRSPFRLDPACLEIPSRFEIDFILEGVRHHYGFEATNEAFVSEWLYTFPKAHRRIGFLRDADEFAFGRWLKGQNNSIAKLSRPNSLFLSVAAQNGHKHLSKVFSYFKSIGGVQEVAIPGMAISSLFAREEPDRRAIEFLGSAGTGVVDYRHYRIKIPQEVRTVFREVAPVLQRLTKADIEAELGEGDEQIKLELAHRRRDGKRVYFDLDRESAGTRRLLFLLGHMFHALDEGTPVFVDELDASLHTQASAAVLELFCSPTTNRIGAQLLATTHDTNLLKLPRLRRDQVWLTQKDVNGATRIYPLTDIRTRKGDNLEKGYLQGRYGAVPFQDLLPISDTPE